MNEKRPNSQHHAGGVALSDIYFILFRHKWKLIICTALGLVAATVIYFTKPMTYQSEAQLLIRYVKDGVPMVSNPGERLMPVDANGEAIVNTEVAILGSFNVAQMVATNIGPSNILAATGGGNDPTAAADLVRDNLLIERVPGSPVLRVLFAHHDPRLVQPILKSIIDSYQAYHIQIHGARGGSFDSLVETTGNLHTELLKIEEDLHKRMSDAGIIDLDGTKKKEAEDLNLLNTQIMTVNDELALHTERLRRLQGDTSTNTTVAATATNLAVADTTNTLAPVPQEMIDDYDRTVEEIDSFKKQLIAYREQMYRESSTLVQETKDQIKQADAHRKQLEKDEPRLVKIAKPAPGTDASAASDPITAEQSQVDDYTYKLKLLRERLARVNTAVTNLGAQESAIRDSQLAYQLKEMQYKDYLVQLNAAKANIDIGALKDANIVISEDPMPPSLALSKTPKFMAIAALAGILAGVAWALLMEYYFDTSVRRPKEVEADLNMRLFLSIPDVNRNGHRRPTGAPQLAAPRDDDSVNGDAPKNGALVKTNGVNGTHGNMDVAPWDSNHSLHHYYEALRDRLITYFEVNNLNHKPKLVAVTGSGQGCGTSTIAGGLAASLSETGEGNVLLIDMNIEQGAAHQFFKGKPSHELEHALANETRDDTKVQKNLYVVSGTTNGDQLARMLPKRFANLVPSLKASDYDYIIFDMPPIARTGVTQRLAGFMDMMLLVVEAEKTSRDVVRQAGHVLTESKANVSVVLNKTRTYIPEKLHQEF